MTKQASPKHAPEVRELAVRMVFEHEGEHASQWVAKDSAWGRKYPAISQSWRRAVRARTQNS
ncbi:Insertion element IS401 (Burkholderia multivorans) transposase [Azospirillum argentinense]|uniref:hypothetical protein n=1 Tax=Azospirillum argentinense TaxID=2970906 RepID=UPI0032DF8448